MVLYRRDLRIPYHAVMSTARRHLIPVKTAATYLGVTERTVRRMIADGRLTGYRLKGSRFIRVDLNEINRKLRPM